MKDVKKTVEKCHQEILDNAGIKAISNLDMKMSRENGIDSLGMVTLIISIEEELEIELDDYLAEIRNAKHIRDIVNIIKKSQAIS